MHVCHPKVCLVYSHSILILVLSVKLVCHACMNIPYMYDVTKHKPRKDRGMELQVGSLIQCVSDVFLSLVTPHGVYTTGSKTQIISAQNNQ